MSRLVTTVAALGVALAPLSARAETPVESSPSPPGNGGLYVRVALGASWMYVARETEARGSGGSYLYLGDSSSLEGFAANTSVSVGGTLGSGLVVAGTWAGFSLPGAELTQQDASPVDLDTSVSGFFLGPTLDAYPTTSGLHFGGGAGYLTYGADVLAPPGGLGARGAGVLVHVGWDFWIDRDWAIGVSLRGLLGRMAGSRSAGGVEGSEVATAQLLGLDVSVLLY